MNPALHLHFFLEKIHRKDASGKPVYRTDKEGRAMIYGCICCNRKRKRFSTGLKCQPKDWDTKKEAFKGNSAWTTLLNSQLTHIRSNIMVYVLEAAMAQQPVYEYVLSKMKQNETAPHDFWETAKQFLEAKKGLVSKSTLQTYVALFKTLKAIEKESRHPFTLDSIVTEEGIQSIKSYSIQIQGINNNTLHKHLGLLKTFLRWCERMKLILLNPSQTEHFRQKDHAPKLHPALSLEEFTNFRDLNLNAFPALEQVRDLFILACFTGLRFSDLRQLNIDKVLCESGICYIPVVTTKDKESLKVALPPKALEILEKYPEPLSFRISNACFNKLLKKAAKKADLSRLCSLYSEKGSRMVETTRPLFELISAHTARRTYASISIALSVKITTLKTTMGHSDVRQTQKYIKGSPIEILKEGFDAWSSI